MSGPYPSVRGGIATPTAGDVWKFGTTVDIGGRYAPSARVGLNLKMVEQARGTATHVLIQEKLMLIQHAILNGSLPPGNRIFK